MGTGRANLAIVGCSSLSTVTNNSTMNYPIVIRPRLAWHAADGTVTQATVAVYAEVHIDVTYMSPLSKKNVTDTYSMVLSE